MFWALKLTFSTKIDKESPTCPEGGRGGVIGLGQSPKKTPIIFGSFPNPTFPFRNFDNDDYEDDIYVTMMNLSVIFVMPCII